MSRIFFVSESCIAEQSRRENYLAISHSMYRSAPIAAKNAVSPLAAQRGSDPLCHERLESLLALIQRPSSKAVPDEVGAFVVDRDYSCISRRLTLFYLLFGYTLGH
jgi:hypothetical protein